MTSTKVDLESLLERLNLSNEEKFILDNPPEIIKSSIEYLVSFSNSRRNEPPRKQNAWLIFLKNYRVYLKKILPKESFAIGDVSTLAADEWNELNDTDYTKRYFKILEKVAEESRQYFLKNDNYLIQRSKEKYSNKWKMYVPDSKLLKEIKEMFQRNGENYFSKFCI